MTYRTVALSSFEEYLTSEAGTVQGFDVDVAERNRLMSRFPYALMLKMSFPEIDFACRWCWQNFGPSDGDCTQKYSIYRACDLNDPHSHTGKWTFLFYVKLEYDFGFIEWYFAEIADRDMFLANIDNINWGENFPKLNDS